MIKSVSPRLAIWIAVVTVLMASVLFSGQKLQLKTVETAYAVAAKRILDKANFYKETWVIHRQPQMIKIDDKEVYFNSAGWPLPIKDGVVDCHYWLILLNENEKIFGTALADIENISSGDDYACTYSNKQRNAILLKLINNTFSVNIGLSSL